MHKETVTWEEDFGIVPEKKHKHAVNDLENGEAPKEPKIPEPAH